MSATGWRALAEHYQGLPDDELDRVGVQAVRLLRCADDEAAWQWFAKAVQRGLVYEDMRYAIDAILGEADQHSGDGP